MPNRIIKESICTSGNIDALSNEAEIMFYRLIVNCDDHGRMDARPAILRAKCFPLRIDKVKDKDVERWLEELIGQGLLSIYEAKGNRYMQLRTWTKHQQVRATRSKYPGPDDDGSRLISSDISCNQPQADVPVIQSNPIQSESYSIHDNVADKPNKKQPKVKYADNVSMTEEEHAKLVEEYGDDVPSLITILDNYKGASGKTYKSDYKAILSWVVKRLAEDRAKARPSKPQPAPSPWDDPRLLMTHIHK